MTDPAFSSTSSPTEPAMSLSNLEQAMPRSSSGVLSSSQKVRSRTHSFSSDRPSTVSHGLMSPPLSVSPEAAFIAASAASQIVTNDHDSHADTWYDQHGIEPSGETALASPAALQLVNTFLDQLLFNFLSVSRSTTLAALRPAVSEVLKPKLAKDAIGQADEELREYLGGGEDGEAGGLDPPSARDWDLELVWKRTRLRCMVYSSLGDMEEEDEDYYMEREGLRASPEEQQVGAVPAAVSIFLTSILEFMGEAALVIAGQAACQRLRSKHEKEMKEGLRSRTDAAERIVVQDVDMERVALDRTLGRLWRTWKKKLRSSVPGTESGSSRPQTRDSMRSGFNGQHLRQSSFGPSETVPEAESETAATGAVEKRESVGSEPGEEYLVAAGIPLPMRDNDVAEIEVPGLCSFQEDDQDAESLAAPRGARARPKSLMVLSHTAGLLSLASQPPARVGPSRKRSNSLPTTAIAPVSPAKRQKVDNEGAHPAADPSMAGEEDRQETSAEGDIQPGAPADGPTALSGAGGLAVANPRTKGRSHTRNASSVSAVIDTAAAVEVATVAGFRAQARAEAEAEAEADEDTTDIEEDGEVEEPQVLTSSRLSLSGRSVSPATSEPSRASPVNRRPGRTLSVHSLRLIEVTGPRSPSSVSRGSSVDAAEPIRPGNASRTNSVGTTPIVEEYRAPLDPAAAVRAFGHTLSPTDSISEAEEIGAEDDRDTRSPPTQPEEVQEEAGEDTLGRPLAKARSPARFGQVEPEAMSPQPIFGSARHKSPPLVSPRSAAAAAATNPAFSAASSPNLAGGTFFFDDHIPEVPEECPGQNLALAPVHSPNVPMRSLGRHPTGGGQQKDLKIQTSSETAAIGLVSVQSPSQSRTRATPEDADARTPDQPGRQPHATTSPSASNNSLSKVKPTRGSEDSVAASAKTHVALDFEELIQSNETIQYTLTPQSMRDDPFNSSPNVAPKSRKSEDAHRTGDQSRGSPAHQSHPSTTQQSGAKGSTSVSRAAGSSAQSVATSVGDAASVLSRPNGPGSRFVPPTPSKTRPNAQQARDARMPRESIADFADFIRSTGPPGQGPVPVPAASGASGAGGANAFTRATGQAVATGAPSVAPSSVAPKASVDPARAHANAHLNRPRKQARDATVDQKEDNSDLIDFIRRGPPNAVDNHRIPRTVAPFRTTMDSDQMAGAVGGRAVDAQIRDMNEVRGSQASTTVTDYSMPSVQSSANSQTGLLLKQNPIDQGPSYGAAGSGNNYSGRDFGDDMPIPKRKTRRVRDPYAIDLSDEEDEGGDMPDGLEATPKVQRRVQPEEESLADFLRNYAPPAEPTRAPIQPFSMSQMERNVNRPTKKASTSSLMSRFTSRRDSVSMPPPPESPRVAPPPPHSYSVSEYPRSVATSRAGSISSGRHIPLQVSMPPGVDKYSPSVGAAAPPSTSGARSKPPVSMHNNSRTQMKRYEPREAASVPARGATADLADFLRNSGPPPGAAAQPMPPHAFSHAPLPSPPQPQPQNESKNGGFFGRRKKSKHP